MGKIIKKRIEYGGSSNSAENIKYDDTKNVKEAINEVKSEIADVNSNLDLDFSNASEDVQNVKTLLQNLLDRFYPNVVSAIFNGLSRLTATSSNTAWVYSEETFDISSVENTIHLAFTVVSSNARVWLYGLKEGVPTTLVAMEDGWNTSYTINQTINRSQYDSIKVKIGAFGSAANPTTTTIQDITCELS